MIEQLIAYVKENKGRTAIIAAVSILCLFLLGNLLKGSSTEKLEHPDGYTLVCQNPSCQNEFVMSVSAAQTWREKHPGEPIKCPKCGQAGAIEKGSRDQMRNQGEPTAGRAR
jgi:hypothetical protein